MSSRDRSSAIRILVSCSGGKKGTSRKRKIQRDAAMPFVALFSHQTGYPIKIPNDENKLTSLKIAGPPHRHSLFPVRPAHDALDATHPGLFYHRDVITRASSAYLRLQLLLFIPTVLIEILIIIILRV